MRDEDCAELLKWLLPSLDLRWEGFRRVYGQVCKRFSRRLDELGLHSTAEYRQYLATHPQEWDVADSLCIITISRFYRDKGVFEYLATTVLPRVGARALETGRQALRIWSAGCGSGEEPYTLALVWELEVRERLPGLELEILATDIDDELLRRAAEGRYPSGCLRELPEHWRAAAFETTSTGYRLRDLYRARVTFRRHDLRDAPPPGPFDVVLCRNLAFTYFEHGLQLATARRLHEVMAPGGALVLGRHERLPPEATEFVAWSAGQRIYARPLHAPGTEPKAMDSPSQPRRP
jgi:chemotaxis protein methyltransferase CheR